MIPLHTLRRSSNTTQAQLVKRAGFCLATIRRMESKRDYTLSSLYRYLDAIGCTLQLYVTNKNGMTDELLTTISHACYLSLADLVVVNTKTMDKEMPIITHNGKIYRYKSHLREVTATTMNGLLMILKIRWQNGESDAQLFESAIVRSNH